MTNLLKAIGTGILGTTALFAVEPQPFDELSFQTLGKKTVSLKDYKNHVMLFVNTASNCGFTGQYKGLQEIYEKYKDQNFVIFGMPSNDFGKQEPGSAEDIRKFCDLKFKVKFPLAQKIKILGKGRDPIYNYLLQNSDSKKEVKWNFEKFLVDGSGKVLDRFSSATKPKSKKLVSAIEKALIDRQKKT